MFALTPAVVDLPRGAFVGGGRDVLRHQGRPICAFTRGRFRPCLHPVWTPAGYVVTSEQPADHPHHRGIWIASDHVGLLMPGPGGVERYDYNFYVDEVFQGRAPGRIQQNSVAIRRQAGRRALLEQQLEWIGPAEWGAQDGRPVLSERRWTAVTLTETATIFDITTEVSPAGDNPVVLGQTRHAWFNARLADGIALAPVTAPVNDQGARSAANISDRDTAWVDYAGPVGGGAVAGLAVIPARSGKSTWFAADWGVISVGQIRDDVLRIEPGEKMRMSCRFVAYDGPGLHPSDNADGHPTVSPEGFLPQEESQ